MRRVLIIAFHFPPGLGSSGVQRAVNLARYLPERGWEPTILTATPRAYVVAGHDARQTLPDGLLVRRTCALDAARHLSVFGRYPAPLAWPDRWSSWWLSAVPAALGIVRRWRPHAMISTFPIATSHLVALSVNRLTGLRWLADFRDSMTEEDYPASPTRRRIFRWIERRAVERAGRVVFTTPGTRSMYAARYPAQPDARWAVVENGYDEADFEAAARGSRPDRVSGERLCLLHSGILYPEERDPTTFYEALARLRRRGVIAADNLEIRLRSTGHDGVHRALIERAGIDDIVRLEPGVPYVEALQEMLTVDGLLLFQAESCNHQIPAKLYEYMRAQRPILALTDPAGDTAAVISRCQAGTIVPLDDADAIERKLDGFIRRLRSGEATVAGDDDVRRYSRRSQVGDFAALLDAMTDDPAA